MSPFQAKYGVVPKVDVFHVFGCISYVHVAEQLRDSTFADKAYKGFFVGLKWPLLDRYLVFVPALYKVVESAHVLFDEVTPTTRKGDDILVVDPTRKTLKDFEYLRNLAYVDDENGVTYVTTRVTTQRVYSGIPGSSPQWAHGEGGDFVHPRQGRGEHVACLYSNPHTVDVV